MAEFQAEQIENLRRQGVGYRSIGNIVGLSRDIVRNYCKSKGLDGYAKYAAFKVLVLDEWLIPDLSKGYIEFIFELSERRFDTTSTIFCTLYKQEEWVKRLGGGAYAESIVERFAYNVTWIETGDVNMRQIFSHV